MKIFLIFVILAIAICIVNSEEEFGRRISKTITKSNSTDKDSVKTKRKDLDTHESVRTYEYALAPFEVQSHYPKVIAEEHTLHELSSLTPALKQGLPLNEAIILTDNSDNYGSTSKSLYGVQRMPKHYGSGLPLYRDDPKDQLKGYLPAKPYKPALPMHAFSQVKEHSQYSPEEITVIERPQALSAPRSPYESPYQSRPAPVQHIGLTGYSTNLEEHIRPVIGRYAINKYEPSVHPSHSPYPRHFHLDYIPGIPGRPWKDYPIYHSIPYTNFKCKPHTPGYFADIEAGCQVWHYCQLDGRHDPFLCSNGTLFNQKTRVCDWWYNVDCQSSVLKYGVNADLYRVPQHKKYLQSSYNPINNYEIASHEIPVPHNYHAVQSDLHNSGHGLDFAESQALPQKQVIKRVRKVKINIKTNTTESGIKNSTKTVE